MDYFALFNLGYKAIKSIRITKYANLAKDVAKPIGILFASGLTDKAMDDIVENYVTPYLMKKYNAPKMLSEQVLEEEE